MKNVVERKTCGITENRCLTNQLPPITKESNQRISFNGLLATSNQQPNQAQKNGRRWIPKFFQNFALPFKKVTKLFSAFSNIDIEGQF